MPDEQPAGAQTSAKTPLTRAASSADRQAGVFVLPRQKSRSRERRESRMFLVDGQLCWADSDQAGSFGGIGSKRNSSMGLLFGSSMDLSGMSMGHSIDSSGGAGSGSEEAISYRIKWCRENIMQLKRQTWPMEKKLQVLKASKLFIKQHQGELKQSKQAKDVIASTSAIFERYWRHFKREFANFLVIITPWEMRIKKIESHFGSVVASYFTFLRWIFWLNLANSLVMVAFVMVPELIENAPDLTGMRKGELGMQQPMGKDGRPAERPEFNPTLGEMWEFEGFLKFSPIFYGYYSNIEISRSGFWRNPLAFLLSAMLTYLFCFFCISRKLSQNTKLSRIGSKDDEYTFCWTVFVGWDFMIGNSETAYNKTSSLVMNLKEGILEEKEQTKDRDWRLIIRRVMANVLTLMLIVASAYVVTLAVQRSENLPEDASLLQKNELQLVMSGIQFMFPPLFDVIGIIEKYHPRKALSWQLGRILFLDFLNFYTLMFSLFGTVDQMGNQLNEVSGNITLLRKNNTYWYNLFTTTTTLAPETTTLNVTSDQLDNSSSNSSSSNSSNSISGQSTTTIQPTWLSTDGLPGSSSEPPVSTPTGGSNLSAGTLLTSVLLASSTVMPSSTNLAGPGSSGSGGGGEVTSASTEGFGRQTTIGSSSSMAADLFITTSTQMGPTTRFEGGDFSTTTPTPISGFSTEPVASASTTIAATTTNRPIRASTETDTDQDYPDLNEVLGRRLRRSPTETTSGSSSRHSNNNIAPRGRLRKGGKQRKVMADATGAGEVFTFDPVERDDSGSQQSEELVISRAKAPSRAPFYGAFIPPIQDPYRKVGTRINWMAQDIDEEEEEPLEGRLEPSKQRTPPPISPPSAINRPTARSKSPAGIARPIGGGSSGPPRGSRFQMSRPPLLDDDANEDIMDSTDGNDLRPAPGAGGNPPSQTGERQSTAQTGEALDFNQQSSERFFTEPTTPVGETVSGAPIDAQDQGLSTSIKPTGQEGSTSPQSDGQNGSTTDASAGSAGGSQGLAQAKSALGSFGGVIETSVQQQQSAEGSGNGTTGAVVVTTCGPSTETSTELRFPNGTSLGANLKSSGLGFNASEVSYTDCVEIPDFKHQEILALNDTLRDKLKSLCWETMFGQEMVKIVVMDLVMTVISAVSFEFMRACFVRYCNRFFFWDLERGFPGYQDFKIAENVLHLVNNQSTVWMGMFFAPGLPAINTVKLAVLMYVRSWAVLTCNIPHETVFKVSKSNNFYYWILLINLLICILPVAYAVTWIRPSWHCGPFGGECRMYLVVTKLVKQLLPPEANTVFRYITSPGAVIPILISLILIIYYLASTVSSSKEANKELKAQLKKDKEQEAAVPEITNTTVADTAPAVGGLVASATAPAAQVPVGPASAAAPGGATGPNQLSLSTGAAAADGAPQPAAESRPPTAKSSLLMPPPL